ncbi:MerR family transcriptional regulator [Streptomyces silvensis]|uniref:helix-turn-helix domain-containing protein n=1 Tax=Streptomyces silvensis TaxID=1765722 RepID=UPI001F52A5BE|nr:MerR family transcriptional regulator [Streptomyces silvensis]
MTRRSVLIGDAAALFGLAPSTVRWWESRGVLVPPARDGGKRLYGDADLRRIGAAYLCCVVGRMPLDRAAAVTSGTAEHSAWQRVVGDHLALLERQIGQLEAAREYLRHLLLCEDDDIAECRLLEGELSAHTPRGRVHDPDLVTAARAARGDGRRREERAPDHDEIRGGRSARDEDPRGSHARDENPGEGPARDENPRGGPRPSRDETQAPCPDCRGPVPRAPRGRPRTYCSRACRQRAYRRRHRAGRA